MGYSWTEIWFWDLNNKKWRKWCIFVYPILFNNNYGLSVIAIDTKIPNQLFYISLVGLQSICAKYGLETWFSLNDGIRKCLLDMKHGKLKTRFETWKTWNDVNGVSLFHLSNLITLMAYLYSQRKTNVQIKYFMIDWC
jgi:hypothetical protein